MTKNKKRFGKGKWAAIVCGVLVCLAAVFLIIVNVFIPLKYLSAYLVAADKNAVGQMRVSFLDVGYGDCTIIEFPDGKTALIDGGDGTYPNNLKILKALNKRGINNIDYLVCTSACPERCGGLAEIMKFKTVSEIFAPYFPIRYYNSEYYSFRKRLYDNNIEPKICEYGSGIFNDEYGYNFCFLSPSNHLIDSSEGSEFNKNHTKQNADNASAVTWLEYGGIGFLLMGNGGEAVQRKIIKSAKLGVEIDGRTLDIAGCAVLKVPDHGSASAAYGELYDFFKPEASIISVGENGYKCPSVQALSGAYQASGGNLYRTDEDGTLTVTVSAGSFVLEKEKK
ncbi:MAG: hypothetical protein K2L42_00505 [Clostridia bacterium]|nr:hypothetical protein [Clostridia bacterium]